MRKAKETEKKSRLRLPLHVYIFYLVIITFLISGVTFSKYITLGSEFDFARAAHLGNIDLYELDESGNRLEGSQSYQIIPGVDLHKEPVLDYANTRNSEMSSYVFLSITTTGWRFDAGTNQYDVTVMETIELEPAPGEGGKAADTTVPDAVPESSAEQVPESTTPEAEPVVPEVEPVPEAESEPMATTQIEKKIMGWGVDTSRWQYLCSEVLDVTSNICRSVYYIELKPGEHLSREHIISGNCITVSSDLTEDQMVTVADMAGKIEFEGYAVQSAGFDTATDAWNAVKGK